MSITRSRNPPPPDPPGTLPNRFWHVQLEVVTVCRTDAQARQRVAQWLTEHEPTAEGWINIRPQEDRD